MSLIDFVYVRPHETRNQGSQITFKLKAAHSL